MCAAADSTNQLNKNNHQYVLTRYSHYHQAPNQHLPLTVSSTCLLQKKEKKGASAVNEEGQNKHTSVSGARNAPKASRSQSKLVTRLNTEESKGLQVHRVP